MNEYRKRSLNKMRSHLRNIWLFKKNMRIDKLHSKVLLRVLSEQMNTHSDEKLRKLNHRILQMRKKIRRWITTTKMKLVSVPMMTWYFVESLMNTISEQADSLIKNEILILIL